MNIETELRDRMVFLCKSLCKMLETARWTVIISDEETAFPCLCDYEITYYQAEDAFCRIALKIRKDKAADGFILICEDTFGNTKCYPVSKEYIPSEYVPVHEYVRMICGK